MDTDSDKEIEKSAKKEVVSTMSDELLLAFSHDLRSPLTSILGWCHIVQQYCDDPTRVLNGIEIIERNASAQSRLITDVLDLSAALTGQLELDLRRVDLRDVISIALDSVPAQAKGIQIHIDSEGGFVNGEPSRLKQIVVFLVDFAVNATSRDGHIFIGVHPFRSRIQISITNTVTESADDLSPLAFDQFREAKPKEIAEERVKGIGMSLARELIELHDGTLRASRSRSGSGVALVFELPSANP